jgi:hypothetical protein
MMSEKREIYTNYNGYHRPYVKHVCCLSDHFSGNRHFQFSIK